MNARVTSHNTSSLEQVQNRLPDLLRPGHSMQSSHLSINPNLFPEKPCRHIVVAHHTESLVFGLNRPIENVLLEYALALARACGVFVLSTWEVSKQQWMLLVCSLTPIRGLSILCHITSRLKS